ncbi:hypothetical protein F2P81_009885 [Scophthalmus maximus]|uniref:Uncharacterized protein n=1 Tax=Scophthalmus maximus TaxID=52904 RepID=A0A6A4T189_SCOMX|nr:hypothetical protein F2P81_009885 [Scophthalmus maximus]
MKRRWLPGALEQPGSLSAQLKVTCRHSDGVTGNERGESNAPLLRFFLRWQINRFAASPPWTQGNQTQLDRTPAAAAAAPLSPPRLRFCNTHLGKIQRTCDHLKRHLVENPSPATYEEARRGSTQPPVSSTGAGRLPLFGVHL